MESVFLGEPHFQSAVQHRHIVVTKHLESPPNSATRENALAVIDHNTIGIGDSERLANKLGKMVRRRQHVRKTGTLIGNLVNVEKYGRRNAWFLDEFLLGVAPLMWEEIGGIDDFHVRVSESLIVEPFAADQIGFADRILGCCC